MTPKIIYESGGQPYYIFGKYKIKILWTNKFIKLNKIILGNKNDSKWEFKQDEITGGRLTIKFSRNGNDSLLLSTAFKFHPPSTNKVYFIGFTNENNDEKHNYKNKSSKEH